MRYLVFIVVYPILWCISMLPFRILYIFSDFVFLIVYYIIGYRKKLVKSNIALAMPYLTEKERIITERKFYKHLCDIFLEMAKTMTISKTEMNKRYTFTNLEVYKQLESEQKSIAVMIAHYASYEWVISLNHQMNYKGYAIYKRLSNPHFDKLVIEIRSKFKAYLISTREAATVIQENFDNNILGSYGFASDQAPRLLATHYWGKFMGIETNISVGAEKLAKEYNMNVVFIKTKKVKRGYYQGTFEVLSKDAKSQPDYQITDKFTRLVEGQIMEAPEFYLWTHKRWKHRKEDHVK